MRKIISLFVFILYAIFATCQSPYELNYKNDAGLLTLGALGTLSGILIETNLDPLSEAQINALNPNDINKFDRRGINNYVNDADIASDFFKYGAWVYPFTLLISTEVRNDIVTVGVMGAEVFLWNAALTTITKGVVKRPRPYTYNPAVPFEKKNRTAARLSFYSGHTSGVSVLSFFSAKVFADFHPESKWRPVVWSAAVLLPSTTGYLRYRAGRHFKTDVITGVITGAIIGILIPEMHKKKDKDQKVSLSVLPVVNGLGVALNW